MQMSFQVYEDAVLCKDSIKMGSAVRLPKKQCTHADMLPSNNKKSSQSFLGIIKYLGTFSPSSAEVCGLLRNSHPLKQSEHGTIHAESSTREQNSLL